MVKRYLSLPQIDIAKAYKRAASVDNWALQFFVTQQKLLIFYPNKIRECLLHLLNCIQWRIDDVGSAFEDLGADHVGFDVFVSEEFLYSSYVVDGFEKMGGEAMVDDVRGDTFLYFDCFDRLTNSSL